MEIEKRYTYKGKLIVKDHFRYSVQAYGYENRFKTLADAKQFIDRLEVRGDLDKNSRWVIQ